jgi:hypothetical protein
MARATKARSEPARGWYVYGIVPADVVVSRKARGIGEPPAPVEVVASGDVAALVSEIELDRPIGTTEDLMAHQNLLDATSVDVPVLPMRFGAVLVSRDAVLDELIEPNENAFADALRELEGVIQYVLRARYVEDALMRQILTDDKKAAAPRDKLQGQPPESTQDIRVQLGERVNAAIEARRQRDTDAIIQDLESVTRAQAVRAPTHELDAAHMALLVDMDGEDRFLTTMSRLARDWEGRMTARLLGPMAPYDFVVTAQPGGLG